MQDALAPKKPATSVIPTEDAERRYSQLTPNHHRKSFGQFFTPARLAALMADWISENDPQHILDPALGTGILTRAALNRCPTSTVTAYELDGGILFCADIGDPSRVSVLQEDFLLSERDKFDAIIMNPPYIRHRELKNFDAVRSKVSVEAGFVIPKSANLYVYFVIKACQKLKPGGRGAFLIPTEWMNANFSKSFKQFLLSEGGLKQVVLFSGCSHIFQDALTTASILLVEKS